MEAIERASVREMVITLDKMICSIVLDDFVTNDNERECIQLAIDALQQLQTLTNAKVEMETRKEQYFSYKGLY